jgi:hypothetical protein
MIKSSKKRSKYNNKKTTLFGITFDSKAEADRYLVLKADYQAARIRELERQKVFILAPSVVVQGRKRPPLKYIADFTYLRADGTLVVEDVKGVVTDSYRIKRHLMMSVHGIEIQEVR